MSQQLAQILLRENGSGKFEKGQVIGLVQEGKDLTGIFSTVDLIAHHLTPLGEVFFLAEQVNHGESAILLLSGGDSSACKWVADNSRRK